jgi:hypothetical protein
MFASVHLEFYITVNPLPTRGTRPLKAARTLSLNVMSLNDH